MSRAVLIGPTYPYRGGIAHYTTLLFEALQREDVDTLLVSFRRQYPRWLFPGASDKDTSTKPLRTEAANYWLDSLNPFTWVAAFRRIRRYQPTNLILQWWTGYWGPVWLTLLYLNKWFLQSPVTFICHNVLPHEARSGERWLTKQVLRHAARCIVHTDTEANRLRALLPHMPVAVVEMPPFSLFSQFSVETQVARTQLDIPVEVPVILFFGIVRPYKGLDDLIRAMPGVLSTWPSAKLVIAGEFWDERTRTEDLIASLAIGDSIIIDDRYVPDEEVGLYFSAADVVVYPYRRASGSAAMQAATGFGLPIVATYAVHSRGVAERDGVRWVPVADPAALASAIASQLKVTAESPSQRARVSIDSEPQWNALARAVMETRPCIAQA